MATEDPERKEGRIEQRYRLLKDESGNTVVLGTGSQGRVYLAEDTTLRRRVAVKILDASFLNSDLALRRFKREAEAASRVAHAGICPIYDVGMDQSAPFIVMRFIDGPSLSKLIEQELERHSESGSWQVNVDATKGGDRGKTVRNQGNALRPFWGRAARIVSRAARALHAAHEADVIHRDIKPANILIESQDAPVIVDFGLAHADLDDGEALTVPGDFMGTPAYMSPEQLLAHHVTLDRRTDIYSLGVTLFECLTGRRPFVHPSREQLYQAIQLEPAPDVRDFSPGVPPSLAAVVAKAIEKDRSKRFYNAYEFAEAVEAAALDIDKVRSHTGPEAGSTPADGSPMAGVDGMPVFADCRVLREAGRGGSGVVYEAEQLSLKRHVAVKVLPEIHNLAIARRAALLNEARLAATLQHPGIVPVYFVEETAEHIAYVMEYVDGITLANVLELLRLWRSGEDPKALAQVPERIASRLKIKELAERGRSTPDEQLARNRDAFRAIQVALLRSVVSVAGAIDYAHRAGVIHGDIKPSNLMFDGDGRLRVLDFGLAEAAHATSMDAQRGGTPAYMSPERLADPSAPLHKPDDVYSLGAVLYECITLRSRADEATTRRTTRPRFFDPLIHRDLELIALKALEPKSSRRYGSAGAFAEDIQRFLDRKPVEAGVHGLRLAGKRVVAGLGGRGIAICAASLVVVAGLLAWTWSRLGSPRDDGEQRKALARAAVDQAAGAVVRCASDAGNRNYADLHARIRDIEQLIAAARLAVRSTEGLPRSDAESTEPDLVELSAILMNIAGDGEGAHDLLSEAGRLALGSRRVGAKLGAGLSELRLTANGEALSADLSVMCSDGRQLPIGQSALPATMGPLIAANYVVSFADGSRDPIRIPVTVGFSETVDIALGMTPAQVPPGMILVASPHHGDTFVMGDELMIWPDGNPGAETRRLRESFLIDRLEVTNGAFYSFVQGDRYAERIREAAVVLLGERATTEGDPDKWTREPKGWVFGHPADDQLTLPVHDITAIQALAYARSVGRDLPDEEQWERAGRGIDGRAFAYGQTFVLANHFADTLCPVGSFPKDVSVYGVGDLTGSVRECVWSLDRNGVVARGGEHNMRRPADVRLAGRWPSNPLGHFGFRCAMPAREGLAIERRPR